MTGKFVNITGNIGAGTTTICQKLCGTLNWIPSYSQAHNSPFLKKYYQERGNFAFQNQAYILLQSIRLHRKLNFSEKVVCQDYVIYEHNDVYSKTMLNRGYIDSNEYELLEQLFDLNHEMLRKPDLMILLRADTETLMDRIKGRNRDAEQNISRDYLEDLQFAFDNFVKNWKTCPVIEINTNDFDISTNRNMEELIGKVSEVLS